MNNIDIGIENIQEPPWLKSLEPFVQKVLEALEINNWDLSLLLCDDQRIQQLNREFRDKDEPTDVLSFEQDTEGFPLLGDRIYPGDIVISLDTLDKNAQYFKVDREEEFKRLIIHGILHLDGWDHSDNSPEQEMLIYQEKILQRVIREKIF